ncbi:MAG TPA: hypothetical protein VGZ25_10410 [Gemmataceae bacterium]|nr:hypothetical protein [Gemmataceae bacterium]
MGVHGPARASPISPEIQEYHFAAIVAQFESPAVDIFAFDIRRDLTDGEVTQLE